MTEPEDVISALTEPQPSPGEKYYPPFKVTPALEKKAQECIDLYPEGRERSAVLPIIHLIQEKFGYVCPESVPWIAEKCRCEPIHVVGIVTFYPGIRRRCPGKWHIRICRTIACALNGGEELLAHVCGRIGVDPASMTETQPMAVSEDGLWSIEAVECLANCGFGPNLMVNDALYSQMTPEKADALLEEYRAKK